MGGRTKRSKRQSGGSPGQPSQPDPLVIFLDETLHNCRPILDALARTGVAYERHGKHFAPATPDEMWLPAVGRNNWALLTHDQRIRYNELEVRQILLNRVREFVFTSGNLTGVMMAEALCKAMPKIRRLCRTADPPFIAYVSKSGNVEIRYDRDGSLHDRKKDPGEGHAG